MFNHPMRRCTTTATISLATATGSACTSIWRVFYNRTSQEASGLKILTVMITCRSVAPVVGGGPIDNDLRMVHVETSRWTEMHRHSVPNSIFCIASLKQFGPSFCDYKFRCLIPQIQFEAPLWAGRLPLRMGDPAGGSLSSDEYKFAATTPLPMIVSSL